MSYDGQRAKIWTHPIYAEIEELQGRVSGAQLKDNDTPCMTVPAETQHGIPSCLNAVYSVEIGMADVYHLLLFNSTSDMVNEENEKARPALISVVSKIHEKD